MRHTERLAAAVGCAALMAACGGGTRATDQASADQPGGDNPLLNSDIRPEPVNATGCLTRSGDRYIVTVLERSPAITTTYQLANADASKLQDQVDREVRVAGEADPAQVADVRNAPTPAVGTSGSNTGRDAAPGTEPRVKTQESLRVAVRTLKVSSVTPTGNPCPDTASSSPDNR